MRNEKELRESLGFKDKVVYHYCSLDALYGILNSKSFWLTSLGSSNDSMELKIGKEVLAQAIEELKQDYKEDKYLSIIQKIEDAQKDKKYIKHRPKYKYYCLSFVEEKDSLTHWERYANNSKGACIGFNIPLLINLFLNYKLPDIVSSWLQIAEVLYTHEDQLKYTKSFLMKNIAESDKMNDGKLLEVEHYPSSVYYSALSILKPRFKHFGFSSEKEHRIYLEDGEAEKTSKHFKEIVENQIISNKKLFLNISKNIYELAKSLGILTSDKKYGLFKNSIRSYYSMNLSEIWSSVLIPEIILGSKCFQNKRELQSFTKSCGLDRTNIQISKVPLRS